jgi:putative heme-binding domain-containing protein
MRRACFAAVSLLFLTACWLGQPGRAAAQSGPHVQWIGHKEDKAGPGPRYFRRVVPINGLIEPPVDEATLDVAATGPFTVWVNGKKAGSGADPRRVFTFDIKKLTMRGLNALAVEVQQGQGKAAMLARLGFTPNGQSKLALVSDGAWKSATTAAPGWQTVQFNDAGWQPVQVLGPLGRDGPRPDFAWDDRFTAPAGFRVLPAVRIPANDPNFSLINMTFDDKGRLLVSRERSGILLCTDPDKDGVLQTVRPYCTQVHNCQGMCWVKDALLLTGDGPQGTGLYRVRDTKGKDQADEVTLLHAFPRVKVPNYGVQGGMSEHGPHAILHGPDGWIYLVIGNHAWAGADKLAANSPLTRWPHGLMGPDQGEPNTTEDVLLPRLNDARGHASNLLAPGGTIWRLDQDGKNFSLVAAGFRNEFDAAFSPEGELFTFDSDMEWDENLPWYRAVRVCHCPPGADFVWRTGSANTPGYYLDSLPPIYETGRGSPVGLEFYDHDAYLEKYRGTYFMADWAIGVIFAVHLERDGASYKAKVERFCSGAPMNVTDINVGPDGALYFVMGGRGTQGGVYRIVADQPARVTGKQSLVEQVLSIPQPLSAWSRARQVKMLSNLPKDDNPVSAQQRLAHAVAGVAGDPAASLRMRIRALDYLQRYYEAGRSPLLVTLAHDPIVEVRAHAIWLLGVNQAREARATLVGALKDSDALVRRRACEALIRAGVEPPLTVLWPLLGDGDHFVRTAARLVLERIDTRKWAERLTKEASDEAAWQAIVALCHMNQAAPQAGAIFNRLQAAGPKDAVALLDYLRTLQLALIHVPTRPAAVAPIASRCVAAFPHADWRVNRELAIVLTQLQREGQLDQPIVGKLYEALRQSKGDRQQQIHYFYCMRLLKDGWTAAEKQGLAAWYDGTRTWRGGHSFTPFLENIFRELLQAYDVAERKRLLDSAESLPLPALVLATRLQVDQQPELIPALQSLTDRLASARGVFRGPELRQAALAALLKTVTMHPTPPSWPYLVRGLASGNPIVRSESLHALRKLPDVRPKADDAAPYRALLVAAAGPRGPQDRLSPSDRWQAVELLRQWNGRSFGAAKAKADEELKLWDRWFAQAFPKEPPLPNASAVKPGQSKYEMAKLLPLLDRAAAEGKGDVTRGRAVFAKASCIKCHKFGKDGEGVGPDLTSLSKRFKRSDILEAILLPSKVISDQYRSSTIITTSGQQVTGLAAVQGDTVTVVLSDASKVTLKRDEIDSQVASLVSVMPEQLLDPLSMQEIIDLFAFLESEPRQP